MPIRLLALLLCLLSLSTLADERQRLLDQVRASGIPTDGLSLLAVEAGNIAADPLLSINAETPRNPASVTKLITAAVVLREIPLGSRFETRLLGTAPAVAGTLNGDLILQGGGDPSFVSETLWLLANRLVQSGIRAVSGDIVVDDYLFDDVLIDPSRDTKRSDQAYDAPVSAMSFNWNSANVRILPGANVGDPAKVVVDPPSDYLRIHNSATTAAGGGYAKLVVERRPAADFEGDLLRVSGSLGVQSPGLDLYRNITRPALWSAANLKLYLRYLGIEVAGGIRQGQAPGDARLLASVEGRPVEQLVTDMNKVSSNFIAEMLGKGMAARRSAPGTLAASMEIIAQYMADLGVPPDQYLLINPAGLTYANRLSANALVQVLADMYGDFRVGPEFIASLPVAGRDGTLKNRLRDSPAQGWVRAKTGYVEGTVSLAGYAGRTDGQWTIFAFLYNGTAPVAQVRELFDDLSATLTAQ
ncbi:MAG: D-alanyl-D-alanine carboxypeptidase/D-alanyl-D-alanine-endopeptidase [Porticoccaceae bacterium]